MQGRTEAISQTAVETGIGSGRWSTDRLPWPALIVGAPVFWFLPQRTGPTFVRAGWMAAVLAHVIWVTFGMGCVITAFDNCRHGLVAYAAGRWPDQAYRGLLEQPTLSEAIRSSWIKVFTHVAGTTCCPAHFAMGVGIQAGIDFELPLLILAILAMPYVDTRERPLRLLGRTVKLTLWSSTSVVALGLLLQGLMLLLSSGARTGSGTSVQAAEKPFVILIIAMYALWLLRMVIRSATERAEPVQDSGINSETLRCQECGYCLDGIDAGGCCPECGTQICTSIPEYRTPSAMAAASADGIGRQMRAFVVTGLNVLTRRDYFRRLSLQGGYGAARRFAIRVSLFGGLMGCPIPMVLMFSPTLRRPTAQLLGTIGNVWTGVALLAAAYLATVCLFLVLVGFAGLAVSLFGFRPMRRRVTVSFYQSIWLLPIGLSELLVVLFLVWGETRGWRESMGGLYLSAMADIGVFAALGLACHLLPSLLCLVAVFRTREALRQTRYAYE